MDHFSYSGGELVCEDVRIGKICEDVGTPVYIYSQATLKRHFSQIKEAFAEIDPVICFAVKACQNIAILKILAELGSGFDTVSGGEIFRAQKAGADTGKIVFAGVGKTEAEIKLALKAGILMFNVESAEELETVNSLAKTENTVARVAIRVNPDVDPRTHKMITTGKAENKFGVDLKTAEKIMQEADSLSNVKIIGIHAHIGSQVTLIEPFVESLGKVIAFAGKCRENGIPIEYVNTGGGFGIFYEDTEAQPAKAYAEKLVPMVKGSGFRLVLEPGRYIAGNSGILAARVLYRKKSGRKNFVICDAGMNDLIRPALYDAYHRVWPVKSTYTPEKAPSTDLLPTDLVGPICESSDVFARDRMLPEMERGSLVSIFSAGAYGFTMASNYNGRPRPAEVLVSGSDYRVIRKRETYEDIIRGESV